MSTFPFCSRLEYSQYSFCKHDPTLAHNNYCGRLLAEYLNRRLGLHSHT